MKAAVLGSGGREHALAWKLAGELGEGNVFVLPGNGGIRNSVPVDGTDTEQALAWCLDNEVDLVVVGPEKPLVQGMADVMRSSGLKVFGPCAAAARLEGSKGFAKQFMSRYDIPTADFVVCRGPQGAADFVRALGGRVVVKYDGLAAGKGVSVCGSEEEALRAVERVETDYGSGAAFVVEERLEGPELSVMAITDGRSAALLPTSRDHKRALDGDKGPNTGGMGAFCPVADLPSGAHDRIWSRIVEPTLAGLRAEGIPYCGVLYFGIMLTEAGPMLLEYNVRLGDPEAEVLLPALKSSLVEVALRSIDGTLSGTSVVLEDGCFADVVLASGGYPSGYTTGLPITDVGPDDPDTLVFHAGTRRSGDRLETAGGRVLNVVGRGATLDAALEKAYRRCRGISFDGMFYRRDIGGRRPGGSPAEVDR
ncbi:MAG: phosphoribosylamine--glycine ligase [Deltaproteobacteria bacterium]|nr:phosphoribosylamine--glycine ligase [Deltaproteobacteria bacterium]